MGEGLGSILSLSFDGPSSNESERTRKKRERNAKGEKGREGGRDRWKREAEAPTVIMDRPKISRFKGVRNRYVDAVEGVSCQLRTDFLDSLVLGPIVIRSGN